MTTPRDSDKRKFRSAISVATGFLTALAASLIPGATETAVANGDTRTIYLHHAHTGEDIAATYLVNGQYDSRVLEQLNWFLRDWRRDEPTTMDPRLFDVVWEAYRSAGAGNQVINVVSAYRSPETNAMLRARSRAVAKYSQHMLGKAMDTTMPGMPMSQIREIGMRMQRGGVGYYPNANTPFVHLDVGNVRAWPRMTYEQLVRLFPDGKTVHLPTNGQPLPGYEEARAEIEARGNGAYVTAPQRTFGGFLAALFGGGGEDEDAEIAAPAPSTHKQWSALAPRNARGAQGEGEGGGEEGAVDEQPSNRRGRGRLARAEADLPRGETVMTATGAVDVAPQPGRGAQTAAPDPSEESSSTADEGKHHYAKVPLPPRGRPASIDEKVTQSASLETGGQESRTSTDTRNGDEASEPSSKQHFVNAPLPPRRPTGLATATGVGSRPEKQEKAKSSHAAVQDDTSPESQPGKEDSALAYAPDASREPATPDSDEAKPAPRADAQKGDLPPAKPDRSSSNAQPVPASRAAGRSILGAPITGVRSAARASDASKLLPPSRPARLGFSSDAPAANKFTPSQKGDQNPSR